MTPPLLPGLPGPLPPGERLLWQGRPALLGLARRAFHADLVAAYFGLLGLGAALSAGRPAAALPVLGAGALALVLLVALAWAARRTTVYSLTDRRLMLRIGIALPVTVNLPLREIEAASLRRFGDGSGDLPLRLTAGTRLAYLHLWPHVRPWRLTRPEPMLRALPQADAVAGRIAAALAAAQGQSAPALAPAPAAARPSLPGRLAAAGQS
ncbi:photosynthetic complex putative assembly protein PuhB [Methylobacterium sp. ID0610]|uniref:photosynthetic complex putative assembly protein PuhB n=1 Tax=Methylobacterium carpenticola TaxID=3344827 RepID=UPI00369F5828